MTGTLRVTPQKLITASRQFETQAKKVQTLTNNMLTLIKGTCTQWQGDASARYLTRFNSLNDDMTRMYLKITEHSTDLTTMARNYASAEDTNINSYSSFNGNPIS